MNVVYVTVLDFYDCGCAAIPEGDVTATAMFSMPSMFVEIVFGG